MTKMNEHQEPEARMSRQVNRSALTTRGFVYSLALLLGAALSACDGEDPLLADITRNEIPDVSAYNLFVEGADTDTLIGIDVDASWDYDAGTLWLGTDDLAEPLGTLTLTISEHVADGLAVGIENATLSMTDVRVGTALEINGRLYQQQGKGGGLWEAITREYIVVHDLEIPMVRILINPGDLPEAVKLKGNFQALRIG
ncbi:MAG: hypothetical protein OEO79_13225 [Gemmatimonadota bacterium]|nr:hypothetical protein [Gemmatimonadota bacterium]MDH3421952.1 hypothetical protein [Gemmatimonadota bacterium]